ncbi:hypothetical protein MtrunA17_Chr2g0314291 [Medicago truncatula]|uniref:Uncharacterized protein n=1 Tax=Medicago truncatula TaxID=3880 RepID=A0A396JEU8_MEDTR|nr:hypothetical protein MtrunA17_Chr2g0314291 [Medicago truncatula]
MKKWAPAKQRRTFPLIPTFIYHHRHNNIYIKCEFTESICKPDKIMTNQ